MEINSDINSYIAVFKLVLDVYHQFYNICNCLGLVFFFKLLCIYDPNCNFF